MQFFKENAEFIDVFFDILPKHNRQDCTLSACKLREPVIFAQKFLTYSVRFIERLVRLFVFFQRNCRQSECPVKIRILNGVFIVGFGNEFFIFGSTNIIPELRILRIKLKSNRSYDFPMLRTSLSCPPAAAFNQIPHRAERELLFSPFQKIR